MSKKLKSIPRENEEFSAPPKLNTTLEHGVVQTYYFDDGTQIEAASIEEAQEKFKKSKAKGQKHNHPRA